MRHIYVGLSNKKVWCGAKVKRDRGAVPTISGDRSYPITEGEYVDDLGGADLCMDCVKVIEPVRGKPGEAR